MITLTRHRNFNYEIDDQGYFRAITYANDQNQMNWARNKGPAIWGTVNNQVGVSVYHKIEKRDDGNLCETFEMTNESAFDVYHVGTDLGIYLPFPDFYDDAETCMTQCCHTHLWLGGDSSYVMGRHMNAGNNNLGLVMLSGGLQGYSIDRDSRNASNDRGTFIVHPNDFHLVPGESIKFSWVLFWFDNQVDFFEKVQRLAPHYIKIDASKFVLFDGEKVQVRVSSRDGIQKVSDNGNVIEGDTEAAPNGEYCYQPSQGKHSIEISNGMATTKANLLVLPKLEQLVEARCHFIVRHQQCHNDKSHLNGAYLAFDNELSEQYYSHKNDQNGGRERIGMGVLLAYYLQTHADEEVRTSLNQYVEYVFRELYDEESGEVFNDVNRCNESPRLYNYSWMVDFFLQLFKLTNDKRYLKRIVTCLDYFYKNGGSHAYVIGLPMQEIVQTFLEQGLAPEAALLLGLFKRHGDYILERGINYPPHEVNFEQSIVAPAADYLCQLYHLTKLEKYRVGAQLQLRILDCFTGYQPDFHLFGNAIRHWDDYWFGKLKQYGDTFPHYWSALTGLAFARSFGIVETYHSRAEDILRGVLSLFDGYGRASCAMLYPQTINGTPGNRYDPLANDQDWGLYFILRFYQKDL